jgi:predicted nucleotidyltransferase component of viral defense system
LIDRAYITEWQQTAPWSQRYQVEQDLIICRALVEIFNHPLLAEQLAFRGGTALFKLHLPPARYSEDIDLVKYRLGQ